MQSKYGKEGLVAISVSVDDLDDEETVGRVQKFLRDKKATIRNYLLDEKKEFWEDKLKIVAVPCYYVFNREGKIEKKWTEAPEAREIDTLVEELLKQK